MTYEEALAILIQRDLDLDYLPEILDTSFDAGGDVQLGEYTWDYEDATLEITYRDPRNQPTRSHGTRHKYYITLDEDGFADVLMRVIKIATGG